MSKLNWKTNKKKYFAVQPFGAGLTCVTYVIQGRKNKSLEKKNNNLYLLLED